MKRRGYVIAIDGPAGSGKSTVARFLAGRLGYVNVDSGAIYRALTLAALSEGIDPEDEKKAAALAKKAAIRIGTDSRRRMQVFLNGRNVTARLRSARISENVAVIARFPGVRNVARKLQQRSGERGGIVMEGRDIGTAVFPKADFKFYLSASIVERAKRRYRELKQQGESVSYTAVRMAIARRDRKDRTRAESPLRRAKEAVRIDSSRIGPAEVADKMMEIIARHGRK